MAEPAVVNASPLILRFGGITLCGPAHVPQAEHRPQSPGRLLHPFVAAPRSAAIHARPQARQVVVAQGFVDACSPVRGALHASWAALEHHRSGSLPPPPCRQAVPRPVLGPLNQPCPQGIGLDVPAERQEVPIVLCREALEPALVQVPSTAGVLVLAVAAYVGDADPSHKLPETPSRAGPQHPGAPGPVVGSAQARPCESPWRPARLWRVRSTTSGNTSEDLPGSAPALRQAPPGTPRNRHPRGRAASGRCHGGARGRSGRPVRTCLRAARTGRHADRPACTDRAVIQPSRHDSRPNCEYSVMSFPPPGDCHPRRSRFEPGPKPGRT